MKNREGWWRAHGIEIFLLVLVLILTAMLYHLYHRFLDMRTALETKISRVDRGLWDLRAQVDKRFDLLDESLLQLSRISRRDRAVSSLEEPLFRARRDAPVRSGGMERDPAEPIDRLSLGTVVHPEMENLALNWGILRKAFPRRLQDSKRAYLELIDQLGFPITEQQRIQMRKVVHETFGLVECVTTSAGWEE